MVDLLQGLKKGVVLYSIIAIVMGIILILFPETTTQVICFSIAGIILVCGIMDFIRYFSQDFHYRFGYDLILSVLLLGLGIILVMDPFDVAMASIILIGVSLIYDGLLNLLILHRSNQFAKSITDYYQ
ncbi:MAG: DUF308 domain-containing protein [Longibaculum sp.]